MLTLALEAARTGSRVLREAGMHHRSADPKTGTGDWVTRFDRDSEAAIVEVLERGSSGIGILGEEAGMVRQGSGALWAVDPLDGTTNFTRALPVVAVSVALLEDGRPELGVVVAPWLGLEFTAQRGRGAALNGQPLPMLAPGDPDRAVVGTGFPFRQKHRLPRYGPVLLDALRRFEDLRRAGSAALDLAWSAAGTLDGFFELGLGPWDIAAGAAILLEAGGRVTDWSGGSGWLESGDVMAGPPAVHEVLLELAARSLGREDHERSGGY
jgi:myo-inositol-1(or 4)-monophosphatase